MIRTAFITGGAQGLGKAFTQALLTKGVKVCFVDIQETVGRQTESEFKRVYGEDAVMFRQCDVTSESSLKKSFDAAVHRFGNLDLMVNNAGIADESNLVKMININLVAAIQGSQFAAEHMRKDKGGKGGRIVNVSSTAGLIGVYICSRYCASKFGLVGYHHSVAQNPHNSEYGIQYGCLCPAFADTPIIQFDAKKVDYIDEARPIIESTGIQTVESVVKAFMHFIDTEDFNGDVVQVTAKQGVNITNQKHKMAKMVSKM